jgi:hypothetical protein
MHLWRALIALCVLAAFVGRAAVVYKWTDADGVVHFSDQPVPGAEKIITGAAPARAAAAPSQVAPPAAAAKPKPPAETAFSIESPTPDATFFAGAISVRAHLEPALQPNQAIAWLLNGEPLDQPPDALAFQLDDLARGTYTLNATVTDTDTHETQSSAAVTFFVQKPSMLSPAHQK